MNTDPNIIEARMGYLFRDQSWLAVALTHRSYRFENDHTDTDNQRLEFLGDAALGLASAAFLFSEFPECREGDLTRYRSRLTNRHALAAIGKELDLGSHLQLGKGEQSSGGVDRSSNVADAMEAILGAAFLDGGMPAVEDIFRTIFVPYFESAVRHEKLDNPKGVLQECIQKRLKTSPKYRIIEETGPPHDKHFVAEVVIGGDVHGRGEGSNKRAAEMEAARGALENLKPET